MSVMILTRMPTELEEQIYFDTISGQMASVYVGSMRRQLIDDIELRMTSNSV